MALINDEEERCMSVPVATILWIQELTRTVTNMHSSIRPISEVEIARRKWTTAATEKIVFMTDDLLHDSRFVDQGATLVGKSDSAHGPS